MLLNHEKKMTFTLGQNSFLEAAKAGENIFLTGKAGTGKSFIINHVVNELKRLEKHVITVAPTGIAATNVDGCTIHSMFAISPFGVIKSFDDCNFVKNATRKVLKVADVIIIDEVSMLRPDILDAMDMTLLKNGLGGLRKKQVIFVGDMKQLPPILDDNTRSVLYQTYDGDSFTDAHIYQKLGVKTVELTDIMRQTDPDFIEALNTIRDGGKHEYFRQFVHTKSHGIILAPHNSTVKTYNEIGLAAQAGEELVFDAEITGTAKASDFNLEAQIRVKDGCKIMYLVNSDNGVLRNGTIGTFIRKGEQYFIRYNYIDYALERVCLAKKQYIFQDKSKTLELEAIGSIEQYPFKLAYALSIHKAQGMTFDKCTIDLRKPVFMKGQMYVALSRVRTPAGLRIILK
jgi:ATP-dependent DNA helicase PIF1